MKYVGMILFVAGLIVFQTIAGWLLWKGLCKAGDWLKAWTRRRHGIFPNGDVTLLVLRVLDTDPGVWRARAFIRDDDSLDNLGDEILDLLVDCNSDLPERPLLVTFPSHRISWPHTMATDLFLEGHPTPKTIDGQQVCDYFTDSILRRLRSDLGEYLRAFASQDSRPEGVAD